MKLYCSTTIISIYCPGLGQRVIRSAVIAKSMAAMPHLPLTLTGLCDDISMYT